jgi:hypothetical protein
MDFKYLNKCGCGGALRVGNEITEVVRGIPAQVIKIEYHSFFIECCDCGNSTRLHESFDAAVSAWERGFGIHNS